MYARRQPEKTVLYQVIQRHLLTFEQEWTDEASGRTLPKFVLDELHGFMSCGIPLRFPLAFDGRLLRQVLRIFTDTVSSWYRKRHVARGLPCIRRCRCVDHKVLKPTREGKPVTAALARPGRLPEPVKKGAAPTRR